MNLVTIFSHNPCLFAKKEEKNIYLAWTSLARRVKYPLGNWVLSIPTFLYAIQSNTLSISVARSTSCDTGWELAKPSSSITSCRTSVRNLCFSCNTVGGTTSQVIRGYDRIWVIIWTECSVYCWIDDAHQPIR